MSADAAAPLPDCPFQGLEPFGETDRQYFFGREEDQQTIGANLVTAPLTVLYGASGVGKTSVLMAGVIPFVRTQPNVAVVLYRNWQDPDAFRELKAAIVAAAEAADVDVDQPLDRCLFDVCTRTRKTVAVIFDQFEEYLLYNPAGSDSGRRFDAELARAVNREDIDANFLISIREDALAKLDRFQAYIPDVLGNYIRLDHLDLGGARRAIEKPLARYNEMAAAQGAPEKRMDVEPRLVDMVIDQVRIGRVNVGAQGKGRIVVDSDRIETPFLQMVLMKVWEVERRAKSPVLRASMLERLGGAETIVRDHVESVMTSLRPAQRHASAAIFDRLVTPTGSKIAYNADDLRNFAGKYGAAVAPLLERLSDRHVRVLRAVAPLGTSPEVRYEIFHDVLSGAVLGWRTKYLRQQSQKRMLRNLAIVFVVVLAAFYFAERFRDTQLTKERKTLEQIAALQQANLSLKNQNSAKSADLQRQTESLYQTLADVSGQVATLRQLGDAAVEQRKFVDAIALYDKALALARDDTTRYELQGRKASAQAAQYRAAGKYKQAVQVYAEAATLLLKGGHSIESTRMQTNAATVAQESGDLDMAEKYWKSAQAAQRRNRDPEGEKISALGLVSVKTARNERWKRAAPQPLSTSSSDTCSPESMAGVWSEVDPTQANKVIRIWTFNVGGSKSGPMVFIRSEDGFARGDFLLQYGVFHGGLSFPDGTIAPDIVLSLPNRSCNWISTNRLGEAFLRLKPVGSP
ncbi:MAG TPA: hypothetical protein VI670_27230 [Thermoanaerobaculia bacterium]|jgi:tetratricopeptide (TPR) repeat protein